jgi:hypothetical protein
MKIAKVGLRFGIRFTQKHTTNTQMEFGNIDQDSAVTT